MGEDSWLWSSKYHQAWLLWYVVFVLLGLILLIKFCRLTGWTSLFLICGLILIRWEISRNVFIFLRSFCGIWLKWYCQFTLSSSAGYMRYNKKHYRTNICWVYWQVSDKIHWFWDSKSWNSFPHSSWQV